MNAPVHHGQSSESGPAHWPMGVRPISYKGMGLLGVGDDGTIYWDGKPIVTQKSVTLTIGQKTLAGAVALSTIIAALAACVAAYSAFMSIPNRRPATVATQRPGETAPPCRNGRPTCQPWERSWPMAPNIAPGQAVTKDGQISGQ